MPEKKEGSFIPKTEKETQLELLHIPELRISSASFARIQNGDGRYALLINQDRAKKGKTVLTPIGGAIETTAEGIGELKKILDIDNESFEKGNDLRFHMKGAKGNEFREWFLDGKQRELDPTREIIEELIDEAKLLTTEDLEELRHTKAGYATKLAETTRHGQEGQMTLRLLEVFNVELKPEALQKLEALAKNPEAQIRFVTEKEIKNEQTEDGIKIATVTQSLLDLEDTIPEFK